MLIPKIVHFVKIGDPLNQDDEEIIDTWRKVYPDFEIRVHHTCEWSITYKYTLEAIVNYCPARWAIAAVSDVIRVEALCQFGGFYADTDCIAIDDLTPIVERARLVVSDEFPAIEGGEMRPPFIGNFFMGCTPGHPMMWRVLREIMHRIDSNARPGHAIHPVQHTGPNVIADVLGKCAETLILPYPMMSPWNGAYLCKDWKTVNWPKSAYGAHLFKSRWSHRYIKVPNKPEDAMVPIWANRTTKAL